MPSKLCAITGASGFVGSRLVGHLAAAGWQIRALSRSELIGAACAFTRSHFELGEGVEADALAGVDALVHLAYDFGATSWRDIVRVNVDGSLRLFAAARQAGVERVVLVSSVAAFPGARSLYGRAKLEIERAASGMGAAIIRPGLVWGPRGGATFAALQRAVGRRQLVPLPVPPRTGLSLVHEDDLALLVERVLERWPDGAGKLFVAACEQPVAFADLLRSLGRRNDCPPRLVRVPWRVVWAGMRALELAGARPPFRSDSLLSLVCADAQPLAHATASTERYGVVWRPYPLALRC